MIDLYLRANTEADMTAALLAAGVINDEGNPVEGMSIDHIGSFSRFERPTWADEPILVNYPEWHTNLRLMQDIDTSALIGYIIDTPAKPYRVWA